VPRRTIPPLPEIKLDLDRLRALRSEHGYTMEEVGQALGYVNRVGYSYVEKGKNRLSAERVAKLAHMYGVPIESLFLYP
jgi:putative transcriptional regulator